MAVRAQEAEILEPVVVCTAIDVIEFERDRLAVPRTSFTSFTCS